MSIFLNLFLKFFEKIIYVKRIIYTYKIVKAKA